MSTPSPGPNDAQGGSPDPTGVVAAAEMALAHLDAQCEAVGWDLPATLWYLEPGTNDALGLRHVREFTDHPADALVGTHAPNEVVAAVLVTEGWVHPADATAADRAMRATDHPRRRELRILLAVTTTGHVVAGTRTRGEAFSLTEANSYQGRLVEAVRLHLGAPSHQQYPSPRIMRKHMVVRSAAVKLADGLAEARADSDEATTAGAVLADLCVAIAADTPVPPDTLVGQIVAAMRAALVPATTTWEDARQAALADAVADGDGDEVRYLRWLDGAGFAADVCERDPGDPAGDFVVSLVPPDRRAEVTAALASIAMATSEG